MTNELFTALMQWQADGRYNRSVKIDIGEPSNRDKIYIWVYDYNIMYGAHIDKIEDLENLDLAAKKKESLLAELEKC